MSTLKTALNNASVTDFINRTTGGVKKEDSLVLLQLFSNITKEQPKMWGPSIIGFGSYHYKSDRSSQEGDWPLTGFSPRKQSLTLYFMLGFDNYTGLLENLGKHKISKGCLYINKLADVNMSTLEELIGKSFGDMKEKYIS